MDRGAAHKETHAIAQLPPPPLPLRSVIMLGDNACVCGSFPEDVIAKPGQGPVMLNHFPSLSCWEDSRFGREEGAGFVGRTEMVSLTVGSSQGRIAVRWSVHVRLKAL